MEVIGHDESDQSMACDVVIFLPNTLLHEKSQLDSSDFRYTVLYFGELNF